MRILLSFALTAGLLSCAVSCGDVSGDEPAAAHVVYLCRETREIITGPAQATPALNPRTGRATLVRGLYCEKCRKWHAVPPPDVHPGNPLAWPCPVHSQTMSLEGPVPPAN